MFVWPSFRRSVLEPMLTRWLGEVPPWIGQTAPLHGFTRDFIVEDFWKTFAPWQVAIPFLLVVGFAIVYFLGSKGFCTYGCPYGGFFAPLDRLAPLRIRVTDDCNQCGHCTAVCTSNVRVAEEVRDFGMVVDPGCFKCLDCKSVCPNDAIYVGFGKPAILKKARTGPEERRRHASARAARYDLSLGEELWALLAFLVLFRGFRGMPFLGEAIPLLMAVGLAAIGAFLAHKTWRLLRDLNVRGPRVQLKRGGRVTAPGWCFAIFTVVFVFMGAQGCAMWLVQTAGEDASVRIDRLRTHDQGPERALVTSSTVYSPGYVPSPEAKTIALRGAAWLRLARPLWQGGIGLYQPWEAATRRAWLASVAGDLAGAQDALREAVDLRPTDDVVLGLGQVMQLRGLGAASGSPRADTLDAITALYREALQADPNLHATRMELARLLADRNEVDQAASLYQAAVESDPGNIALVRDAATVHMNLRQPDAAIGALRRGLAARPKSSALSADLASLLLLTGQTPEARQRIDQTLALQPTNPETVGRLTECLMAVDRSADALALTELSLRKNPHHAGAIRNAAGMNAAAGKQERALQILREGVEAVPTDHYLGVELAGLMMQLGLRDQASAQLRKVMEAKPKDSLTLRDWAEVAESAGMTSEAQAARQMRAAVDARPSTAPAPGRP
jgi:tetratricopeptide (TPR) repeat protein/NAD-dependent dihydropyrimidine dehydrogenase PreA subunit